MKLQGARILVVDDHADLAENLGEILRDEGATVLHAVTAREAIELARRGFDIALVDIRLPDDTGLNLLLRLRELQRLQAGTAIADRAADSAAPNVAAEVLLITGNALIDDAIEAVKRGAYDYIIKPFDPDQLIASVVRAYRQLTLARETMQLHVALADSELSLRTLVDTVQALLLELDSKGQVIRANRAALRLVGLPIEQVVGHSLFDPFTRIEDQPALRALLRDTVDGRIVPAQARAREFRLLCRRDGTLHESWIAWQFVRLQLESGEVRVYACGIDVSDLRDLERRTRLNEKLAAVGTLAAGLAHEIRNPLNAMSLQMQLLARRMAKHVDDPRLGEPMQAVHREISRLSNLVEDFLRFARPSDLRPKAVDLVAMATQVVGFEQVVAENAGVALSIAAPPNEVVIFGDHEKLRQVLVNLITNAVDAAGRGGTVTVEVVSTPSGAKLSVIDTGPGIPQEMLGRVFEPFFSTKEHGTGLGMAICHSLVTLHGGDIHITCGERTVVVVDLPEYPPGTRPSLTREE